MRISKKLTLMAGIVGFAFTTTIGSAQAEELTVYTSVEADNLRIYAKGFNELHPDIKINWIRDSAGIQTAKLLAEKNNPQADVVMGLAATSLMLLKAEGMAHPYAPVDVEALDKKFVDKSNPPHWIGMDAWIAAICVNTIEMENNNLPMPTSWKDLIKPVYKDQVVMPSPNSSGTGFLDVTSWLQLFGEDEGWKFMDSLHKNIAWYTHSGSKPCRQAAAGEIPIGVSFMSRGAKLKAKGAPIEIILPSEGVGWDMECAMIVKGTKKLAAAKKLMDFAVTKKASTMYNRAYAVVAYPGVAKPVKHMPTGFLEAMIDNDFEWASANRKSILNKWTIRYDSKSEPKKK
jgi:iron(III) transport system substrate-binding protein